MRPTIFATLAILVTPDGTGMAWETAADRFYEQLRQLEGEWEGTFQWSGGRTESGPVRATYSLTAGGHAVIEQLFMGGAVPSMSSIYHIHADELRMTHYCISRTQPRLKATRIDEADRTAEFDVIDVTGTDPQGRPHVRRFRIQTTDPDHLRIWFTFTAETSSKVEIEEITLQRVKKT